LVFGLVAISAVVAVAVRVWQLVYDRSKSTTINQLPESLNAADDGEIGVQNLTELTASGGELATTGASGGPKQQRH
jgi:hypothetical protein